MQHRNRLQRRDWLKQTLARTMVPTMMPTIVPTVMPTVMPTMMPTVMSTALAALAALSLPAAGADTARPCIARAHSLFSSNWSNTRSSARALGPA